jgi:hypothetical protein
MSFDNSAFFYYFLKSANFDILSRVQSDFGLKFVKKMFTVEVDRKENLFLEICKMGSGNVFELVAYLRDSFAHDSKFLKKVFLATDRCGESFLHHVFYKSRNEFLMRLFEELNSLKELLGQDFVNELILMTSRNYGVFLTFYVWSKHFSNDHFLSFLDQVKLLCNQETLRRFFFNVNRDSNTLLHHFCNQARDFDLPQVLEWVARELGTEVLTELILLRDTFVNQTIFHYFISHYQKDAAPKLLSILRFLKNDLNFSANFLIDKILLPIDYNDKNVFLNLIEQSQEKEFRSNFFDFLVNELTSTDENPNFTEIPFWILRIKDKEIRDEMVNLFNEKFGENFFSYFSNDSFHELCERYSFNVEIILEYLNLIAGKHDLEILENNISGKNSKSQTILFYFRHLFEMLEWFGTKFKNDENFLKNFLLEVDENSDSFLTFALKNCNGPFLDTLFRLTYDFLFKNFDKVFVKELLLLENNEGRNCLDILRQRVGQNVITKVLNKLFYDFENDQDFFQ